MKLRELNENWGSYKAEHRTSRGSIQFSSGKAERAFDYDGDMGPCQSYLIERSGT